MILFQGFKCYATSCWSMPLDLCSCGLTYPPRTPWFQNFPFIRLHNSQVQSLVFCENFPDTALGLIIPCSDFSSGTCNIFPSKCLRVCLSLVQCNFPLTHQVHPACSVFHLRYITKALLSLGHVLGAQKRCYFCCCLFCFVFRLVSKPTW